MNALKALEALRLSMLITFRRGFSFLMVKNVAWDTIIDIIRYGSFLLHFGVMGGKSCNNKKYERKVISIRTDEHDETRKASETDENQNKVESL